MKELKRTLQNDRVHVIGIGIGLAFFFLETLGQQPSPGNPPINHDTKQRTELRLVSNMKLCLFAGSADT